jgi:hypothetical protein
VLESVFGQIKTCLDAGDALQEFVLNAELVNLVIATDLDFEYSHNVLEHHIPIVVPEWVFRSVRLKKRLPIDLFLADPHKLFSAVKLCIDMVIYQIRKKTNLYG